MKVNLVTSSLPEPILKRYDQLCARFPGQALGLIEIGSRARGEATRFSDHDLRLVIRSHEPFLLLDQTRWSPEIVADVQVISWEELNRDEEPTVGLTNLGYVERSIGENLFPITDHLSLFQGDILWDPTGELVTFVQQYDGVIFPNIVPDYVRQTEWRVTNRLARESVAETFSELLDTSKCAIPLVHTCCRILRDVANIDTYRHTGSYLTNPQALDDYYRYQRTPDHETFSTLFAYKTDETLRQQLFSQASTSDEACLRELQRLSRATSQVWRTFLSEANLA